MYIKKPIHWIALMVGIMAAIVEGISNIEDISHKVGTLYNPEVMAAGATSIGSAVLLAFTIKAFRQRNLVVGLGLAMTFAFTAAYTISTTLKRTSETRQLALTKVYEADAQWQQVFKVYKATSDRAASECGMGAGPKCKANTEAAILAHAQVIMRQGSLDAMGNQVKWMLSMIGVQTDTDTAGRIQPMFLPLALFLLGCFCIAFGENGEYVAPEFETELVGKAAVEDKAMRFISQYKERNGSTPPPQAVAKVCQISEARARRMMRKAA